MPQPTPPPFPPADAESSPQTDCQHGRGEPHDDQRDPLAIASMCCALAAIAFFIGGALASLILASFVFSWSLASCSVGTFLGAISRDRSSLRLAALVLNCLVLALTAAFLFFTVVGSAAVSTELGTGTGELQEVLGGLRELTKPLP